MKVNRYQMACEMIRIGDEIRTRQQVNLPVQGVQVHQLGLYHQVWWMDTRFPGAIPDTKPPVGLVGVLPG